MRTSSTIGVMALGLTLFLAAPAPAEAAAPAPGDAPANPAGRLLFDDDFSGYELREFPHWWERVNGVFEVGQQGDDRVIVCLETGAMAPKLRPGPLPPSYRLEIDFYGNDWGDADQHFIFSWTDNASLEIGRLVLNLHGGTQLRLLDQLAAHKELPAPKMGSGLHHLFITVTATQIDVRLDGTSIAATARPAGFEPYGFRIGGRINDEEVPCVYSGFRCLEEVA